MKHFVLSLMLFWFSFSSQATEQTTIRIGVQATGTLAWELAVLAQETEFKNASFKIETHTLANPEAGKIALQSGTVDMIVSDWIWVSRMRSEGEQGYQHVGNGHVWVKSPLPENADLTFYPYSTTSGALLVPEQSAIKSIKDLASKKLGIVGGELDKNWLLLQALAQKENIDLNLSVEKIFGAPPLINEQLQQGRIDAVLTYWHFAAKLEGKGYRQLIDGKGILQALGVKETVPNLGYVFKQSWAVANLPALSAFFKASKQAKQLICTNDAVWQKIIPLTQVEDKPTQDRLRQHYCEGTVQSWDKAEQAAAEKIYQLLRKISNNQLTGKSEHIQMGTFWANE